LTLNLALDLALDLAPDLALKTISTNPVYRRIGIPGPFTPIAGMAFDVIAEYDPQRAAGYR
jgi:hypothetical protein